MGGGGRGGGGLGGREVVGKRGWGEVWKGGRERLLEWGIEKV